MKIEDLKGPAVAPIAHDKARPTWSVMIPAFNCAKFLRPCLESVLAQDRGTEQMEIEVVDDCSREDDPETVVREAGQGRVKFHRNSQNQGVTGNFNSCLRRSSGELVHILHGDDYILPGLYEKMEELAGRHPDVSLFHARVLVLDEADHTQTASPSIETLASPGNDVTPFYYTNPFRTAALVIRRRFYEQYGGFNSDVDHVSDWEMWVRAVCLGGGLCINDTLGIYRCFGNSETNRAVQTGRNLRDCLKLADHWAACDMPGFDLRTFRSMISSAVAYWEEVFRKKGNTEAQAAYIQLGEELAAAPNREDRPGS